MIYLQSCVILLLFIYTAVNALANLQIWGVAGTLQDGKSIEITGDQFGSGPTVLVFDQFEGPADSEIPLTGAEVGEWSRYGTVPFYSGIDSLSGNTSMYVAYNGSVKQFKLDLPDVTEAFVSFWVKIPDGSFFPAADSPETFASRSSWKMVWLMDGNHGYNSDDNHFFPDWTGGGWKTVSSNNNSSNWYYPAFSQSSWWSWDKWMRVTYWLRAGENPSEDVGNAYVQMFSMDEQQHVYDGPVKGAGGADSPLFVPSDLGNGIPRYTQLNVPGWVYAHRDEITPLYDDIYVGAGDNAAARIEIGNDPDYERCTKLALFTPVDWKNGTREP